MSNNEALNELQRVLKSATQTMQEWEGDPSKLPQEMQDLIAANDWLLLRFEGGNVSVEEASKALCQTVVVAYAFGKQQKP